MGSAWEHLSWNWPYFENSEDSDILQSKALVAVAVQELKEQPTLWRRGNGNLPDPPHPLALDYSSIVAGPEGDVLHEGHGEAPVDVTGMLLGGDGSGGEHTRDSRLRRCGFGLAVISDAPELVVHHLWYGSVPGENNS